MMSKLANKGVPSPTKTTPSTESSQSGAEPAISHNKTTPILPSTPDTDMVAESQSTNPQTNTQTDGRTDIENEGEGDGKKEGTDLDMPANGIPSDAILPDGRYRCQVGLKLCKLLLYPYILLWVVEHDLEVASLSFFKFWRK